MSKNKSDLVKKPTLSRTHVPDKVYAYSLQVRHALYELLNCSEGEIVSIEVFDDVAVKEEDGSIKATQIKSVLSDKNPISDRAVDLWKTFNNWLLAANTGELSPDITIFKIFVAAERKGSIVKSFSEANTLEVAKDMWEKAKLEFYDKKGFEKNLGDDYASYIREFFSIKNMPLACKIILRFSLDIINESHTNFLYRTFCQKAIIHEDIAESVFIFMLGWIDKKTAELIETGKQMCISYRDFKAQLIAITSEFNQNLSLKELAPRPTEEEIQSEYNSIKIYIGQLDIINCDYTDKIEAINDYLRASTNRTLWANRGYISYDSFEDYEKELIIKWNNKKTIIELSHKNLTASERGKLLYFQCKEDKVNINHLSVPSFFTPGCYHALSDDLIIGWYPDYRKYFKEGSESNEPIK
jgi:hypothetical protein